LPEGEPVTWDTIRNLGQEGRSESSTAAPATERKVILFPGFRAEEGRREGYAPPAGRPDRFTSKDTEALDPARMYDPFPDPTLLHVDSREPRHMHEAVQGVHNLVVESAELDIGDYVAYYPSGDPALIVERKTVTDLVNSLAADDRRLFRQLNDLAVPGATSVLLIEGDPYTATRMTLPQVTGLLSHVITGCGVAPLHVIDARHAAYMIVKLARHAVHGLKVPLNLRTGGPKDPLGRALYVLEGIPGVGNRTARLLMEHFGSVRAIASATERDLRAVRGVGPVVARSVLNTLGEPDA
jgi:Fanconi anemia group M protein